MVTDEARRQLYHAAVEQLADSTYRVAYRLTGHHELARELVQETWLAAWKNIDQLQDTVKLRGWLMGILRNQFSKQLSREMRHCHEPLGAEPLASPESKESAIGVQEALARLDEDHRLPILLVSMEGWSTDEVAELLAIPRGTILSRLHRARQRLKQFLSPDWEFQNDPI